MQGDQNSSADEVQSDQSANLADLRRKIQLTNIQLLQLTYNDEKFIQTIENLNNSGIKAIHNEQYREALVYFNQNEKILEYAASCGKTIDRSVIIVTLHNEACVHQKLWDLQKSANYLEAIIYNLNFYLENAQAKRLEKREGERKGLKEIQQLTMFIKKKQNYALYHLQFCAVNSQIKKHNLSVSSAKSAIKIMKEVCRSSHLLQDSLGIENEFQNLKSQSAHEKNMLKELANLQESLQLKSYDTYLKEVKRIIREKEKNRVSQLSFNQFKTFSIGKLMQISPINLDDMQNKLNAEQFFNYESKITKALYLGISYFTVGTQLRFLSSQKNEEEEIDYKLSEEFLLSEVYHIYAILVVMTFVPVQTIFLNHLLSSFNNHYLIDLEKISEKEKRTIELTPVDNGRIQLYSKKQDNLLPQESEIKTPINTRLIGNKQEKKSELRVSESNKSLKKSDRSFEKIIIFKKSKQEKQQKISLKKSSSKNKASHRTTENKGSNSPFQQMKNSNPRKKEKKKSQSVQRKSHSINKSKKNCIYTTRDEKDRNLSSSPEMLRLSKSKSKNCSKKTSKSREKFSNMKKNPYATIKKMICSAHESHKDRQKIALQKSKGKSKGKKKQVSKKVKKDRESKSRSKKPKMKMKKVQISRLGENYSEYLEGRNDG